jgi:type IV secretory pathway TraG/TraD family ATPase VirD4
MTDPSVAAAHAANAIAFWSALAGWASAIVSAAAAIFAWYQWRKINRKLAMLTDASKAAEVLPAWYTERMMMDYWLFGLVTVSGQTIAITSIKAVSDNGEWMDVDLADKDELNMRDDEITNLIHAVASDRTRASVKISNIVAAIELRTS